ncbi:MAG: hypothetical protein KDC61_08350 [Saprospiraceae bacterium]|nr:hypothetical protein [Saprospiraceae bacterium]
MTITTYLLSQFAFADCLLFSQPTAVLSCQDEQFGVSQDLAFRFQNLKERRVYREDL